MTGWPIDPNGLLVEVCAQDEPVEVALPLFADELHDLLADWTGADGLSGVRVTGVSDSGLAGRLGVGGAALASSPLLDLNALTLVAWDREPDDDLVRAVGAIVGASGLVGDEPSLALSLANALDQVPRNALAGPWPWSLDISRRGPEDLALEAEGRIRKREEGVSADEAIAGTTGARGHLREDSRGIPRHAVERP